MSIISSLVALVIILVGVWSRQVHSPTFFTNRSNEPKVLGEAKGAITPTLTRQAGSPMPTPTLTPTPQPTIGLLSASLRYPHAQSIHEGDATFTLQSADTPQTITNWYQTLINTLHMTTKSFVQTNTNDNVKNALVGSDGKKEIWVDITKSPDQSTTTIHVVQKITNSANVTVHIGNP